VEEVFDAGLECRCQWQRILFENEKVFEESFPADFIRGVQTRLWFYVLHVLIDCVWQPPTGTCGERHGDGGVGRSFEAAAITAVEVFARDRCGFTCWA